MFHKLAIADVQFHMGAQSLIGVSPFECFGQRIDWEDRQFAARQQFRHAEKTRSAVARKATPAFHCGFFPAIAVQIAVERGSEALQWLLPFAALGGQIGQIRI